MSKKEFDKAVGLNGTVKRSTVNSRWSDLHKIVPAEAIKDRLTEDLPEGTDVEFLTSKSGGNVDKSLYKYIKVSKKKEETVKMGQLDTDFVFLYKILPNNSGVFSGYTESSYNLDRQAVANREVMITLATPKHITLSNEERFKVNAVQSTLEENMKSVIKDLGIVSYEDELMSHPKQKPMKPAV